MINRLSKEQGAAILNVKNLKTQLPAKVIEHICNLYRTMSAKKVAILLTEQARYAAMITERSANQDAMSDEVGQSAWERDFDLHALLEKDATLITALAESVEMISRSQHVLRVAIQQIANANLSKTELDDAMFLHRSKAKQSIPLRLPPEVYTKAGMSQRRNNAKNMLTTGMRRIGNRDWTREEEGALLLVISAFKKMNRDKPLDYLYLKAQLELQCPNPSSPFTIDSIKRMVEQFRKDLAT